MKRMYYLTVGVALGVAATRRTRRAKEAAKAAFAAKFTPSAIAADVADAIAEIGQAVGSFASDIRMGAVNRRASYRPMIDGATGGVVMVPPEHAFAIAERRALAGSVIHHGSAMGDSAIADRVVGDSAIADSAVVAGSVTDSQAAPPRYDVSPGGAGPLRDARRR